MIVAPYRVQAVTVGPVKLEFSADPGDAVRGEMFVQNEESETATLHASLQQFTEEDGNKIFNDEKGDIASWIKPIAPVTLEAGAQKKIPFTISVPQDAPPGGHFGVLWWSSSVGGKTDQVAVVTRAGVLLYLTVSGELERKASILSFDTEGGGRAFGALPVSFTVLFKNEGNTYEKPQGTLTLYNIFGGESIQQQANEFGSQILPRSQKTLAIDVKSDRFLFGPYRAVIDLAYGDNVHLNARTWIWFMPIRALSLLIAVGAFILIVPLAVKKYNVWIIGKSRRSRKKRS